MLLVTWNVNGLRARFSEVTQLVAEYSPDVLCLQEIKATSSQVPEPLTGLPDYYNHYHGGPGGYSGVSVHVRRALGPRPEVFSPDFDFETRVVVARIDGLEVASVYVPNGNKDFDAKLRFLEAMAKWSEGSGDRILAGDLNVALTDADVHSTMRKTRVIGQRPDERALLSRVIGAGMRDVVREAHPRSDEVFTWWPPWRDEKAKNHGWRIDFVLAPAHLADRVRRASVLADFGSSDHAPVVVEFGL